MRRATPIVPIVLFAVLALLVIPVFPHAPSPNELSRWAMDVALVDFHTIEISPVIRLGIPLADLAKINGRVYSNKAPGASLLVLPVYAAARAIGGPPSADNIRAVLTALRIAGATIPAILLALWFVSIARRLGCSEERIAIAVAALLFATPVLTYGLLFFSHVLSALTIFGAWILLFVNPSTRRDYAAGVLIGFAVLCESAAVFAGAVLVACALPRLRVRGLLRVSGGALPFAIAFAAYDWIAFGSPFALPNYFDADAHIRVVNRSGLLGLHWPVYIGDILLDPGKGLLVLSPVLLMALAGVRRARQSMSGAAFLALVLVVLAIVLPIAGYPYWFGGRCVGVRYVLPAMPFLALLIAFAAPTAIEVVLLGASVAVIAILSLVFPFVPTIYAAPWVSFAWPLLRDGCVAPNLLHFVWRPLAIVVPFAIVAAAVIAAIPVRRIPLLLAGAVLWFGIGFLAEARRPSPPEIRVLIETVHFQRDGTIQRNFPPGPAAYALLRRAAELERLPPPKWPF